MSSENFLLKGFADRHLPVNSISPASAYRVVLIPLIAVIILAYLPIPGLAQAEPVEVGSLDGLVKSVYRDTKHVLTSPLRWRQDDVVKLATLSIATFGMMITDKELQESVQKNRTRTSDQVSEWMKKYTKRVANLTIGGLYIYGLAYHDRRARETAFLCLESVALAEAITTGLKHLVGRSRPFADKGAFDFNPLESPPPQYSLSLPSGHATTAFAFCSVVAARYPSWPVRLSLYGFAVTVSLARMNTNVHFLSDVFWGGIIGISVGKCLVALHERDGKSDLEFMSRHEPDKIGIGLRMWLR